MSVQNNLYLESNATVAYPANYSPLSSMIMWHLYSTVAIKSDETIRRADQWQD